MSSKKKNKKQNVLVAADVPSVESITRKSSFRGVMVVGKNEGQKQAIQVVQNHDISFLYGVPGTGKAQPLDSIIYCPEGPRLMGDLKVGDLVCTPDGGASKITGIFPQGPKDIYKITFKDESSVECCLEHLWQIYFKNKKEQVKIVDTNYLLKNCSKRTISIQNVKPVYFSKRTLLIEPYLMGLLLGDGGFTNANISYTSADKETLQFIEEKLDSNYKMQKKKDSDIDYRLVKKERNGFPNHYKDSLRKYNLWGLGSHEKFIPKDYLYSSIEDRFEILRGLLDSDGSVGKGGIPEYYTTSKQLMDDFKELVESLGGRIYIGSRIPSFTYKGEKKQGKRSYSATIVFDDASNIFKLKRKQEKVKKRTKYFTKNIIRTVEKIGSKECQCIMINHPDHLYITNNFIPTHNTHIAVGLGLQGLLSGKYKKLILTRPYVEAGEHLGFLKGDYLNKIAPFMFPITEILTDYLGSNVATELLDEGNISVIPMAFMRGLTMKNAFVIADEVQNCSPSQMRMLLTRMGENSKLVVTGDKEQSDLPGKNGLTDAIDRLKDIEEIGMHYLGPEWCVRSGLIAKIEEKYKNK